MDRWLVVMTSELFQPIAWLVWKACFDKVEFSLSLIKILFFFYLFAAPLSEYRTNSELMCTCSQSLQGMEVYCSVWKGF